MKLPIKDLSPETKQAIMFSACEMKFDNDTEWEDNEPLSRNEWLHVLGVFALAVVALLTYGLILFSV